jgi:TIR domain
MVTISASRVRAAAASAVRRTAKAETTILNEARATRVDRFDVFLSHSRMDRKLVLGAKELIEGAGLSVYVDWIDDGEVERQSVDKTRAAMLRVRMSQCDALFYAHTPNASLSRWCPWELGYFDALKAPKEQVYVMAIVEEGQAFAGQEYLGLYQTVDPATYKLASQRVRRSSEPTDLIAARILRDGLGFRRPML